MIGRGVTIGFRMIGVLLGSRRSSGGRLGR